MPTEDRDDDVRIDKWLWAARFFKTRGLAADAIDGGKVEVNGARAKRARVVRVGDRVRLRIGPYEHQIVVRSVSDRRGPAPEAALLYEETSESRIARERQAEQMRADRDVFAPARGRPTKRDRRQITRLRGDES